MSTRGRWTKASVQVLQAAEGSLKVKRESRSYPNPSLESQRWNNRRWTTRNGTISPKAEGSAPEAVERVCACELAAEGCLEEPGRRGTGLSGVATNG